MKFSTEAIINIDFKAWLWCLSQDIWLRVTGSSQLHGKEKGHKSEHEVTGQ